LLFTLGFTAVLTFGLVILFLTLLVPFTTVFFVFLLRLLLLLLVVIIICLFLILVVLLLPGIVLVDSLHRMQCLEARTISIFNGASKVDPEPVLFR
jgi:hypothetical protein